VPLFDTGEALSSALSGGLSALAPGLLGGLGGSIGDLMGNTFARVAAVGAVSTGTDAALQWFTTSQVDWGQAGLTGAFSAVGSLRSTPMAPPEPSQLAYPGGLAANDALGGHVLAHVGRTDEELAARGILRASTFSDRATAEAALADTLAANDYAIRDWLASAPSPSDAAEFAATFNQPIGRILHRGSSQTVIGTTAIAILRVSASATLGYYILTGYVVP
jgi:hypothetical protein